MGCFSGGKHYRLIQLHSISVFRVRRSVIAPGPQSQYDEAPCCCGVLPCWPKHSCAVHNGPGSFPRVRQFFCVGVGGRGTSAPRPFGGRLAYPTRHVLHLYCAQRLRYGAMLCDECTTGVDCPTRPWLSDAPTAEHRNGCWVSMARMCSTLGGRFRTARAQCAHSAHYYGDYPGNNPENHPPAESCTINSKLKNSNV